MQDAGIVRNRAKIEAAIALARIYARSRRTRRPRAASLGFRRRPADRRAARNRCARCRRRPTISAAIAKDLRQRGGNFVGPTIIYAFMQATGMVNDHLVDCHRHAECAALGRERPWLSEPRAWQRMLSGRRLDLIDPSPLDIEIGDIAHGLARVARWNGQTTGAEIFSVAQHCAAGRGAGRRAARRKPPSAARLAALLHDAPEYVIGDMISPFKAVIGGDYKAVEERLLGGDPSAFRPARAGAAPSSLRADQGADRGGGLFRGDAARRLFDRRGAEIVRRAEDCASRLEAYLAPMRPDEAQAAFPRPLRRTRRALPGRQTAP